MIETRHRFMWLTQTRATYIYEADGTCVITLPNRKVFRGATLTAAVNSGMASVPLISSAGTSAGRGGARATATKGTRATAAAKKATAGRRSKQPA